MWLSIMIEADVEQSFVDCLLTTIFVLETGVAGLGGDGVFGFRELTLFLNNIC